MTSPFLSKAKNLPLHSLSLLFSLGFCFSLTFFLSEWLIHRFDPQFDWEELVFLEMATSSLLRSTISPVHAGSRAEASPADRSKVSSFFCFRDWSMKLHQQLWFLKSFLVWILETHLVSLFDFFFYKQSFVRVVILIFLAFISLNFLTSCSFDFSRFYLLKIYHSKHLYEL